MAVKTITANLNVVPVGIENTKAKLQELLKSTNISEAVKLDIGKVLSKIDEIGPRIQGQLSGKGALNIDRMGFGKIDEAIFKIAKNIAKELGVAFDTTKVDEFAKKINDVNFKINANETALSVNEKETEKSKAKITEKSQTLSAAMRGEDAALKIKERILEIDNQLANNVKAGSAKAKKLGAERDKLNGFLTTNKTLIENITKFQEREVTLNKEKAALAGELRDLTIAQEQATNQAISEIPEVVKANEAVKEYTAAKSELIKATMDQAQANAAAGKTELDLNATQKKSRKSLLEKIFALFTFQKAMQFVNKIVRDSVRTIRELDKAITDMALVTTLSRQEAWQLVGAMQNLATATGLATSQIASVVVQFIRQGRTMADAFELAKVAAKSAKVAGIDANEAVNFLTSAVNGFGLAANQAESIADKFAAVAAKSASSFQELASAMSRVAPTAKSAGIGIDFMMGVIAKGIETTREAPENIGTAFKTIFARMREVTDLGKAMEDGMDLNRVEKALLSVGVPLRNSVGQFRNLEDVLVEVGRKFESLTSIEQAYLATALAGSRQQPRLLAIFNDFARTEELIAISAGAAGELEDQHLSYLDGLEAAVTNMRNAYEQVVTAFVSSEVIIVIVDLISGSLLTLSDVIGGLGNPIQNTTVALTVLTAALGIYTFAKYKAAAAESAANAIGALTNAQLLKKTLFEYAYGKALTDTTSMLVLKNSSLLSLIGSSITKLVVDAKAIVMSYALGAAIGSQAFIEQAKNITTKQSIVLAFVRLGLDAQRLFMTARQFIIDKTTLVLDKIKLLFSIKNNAEARKEAIIRAVNIVVAIKDNIIKAATIVINTLLAITNFILSGSFIAVAGSIFILLAPFLLFLAAAFLVGALITGLVIAIVEATRSLDSFSKNIAKANAAMRELENKEKNVKKLTDRFKELDNQVEKTAEDLDEMKSISEELGEVKVGDQAFSIMTEDAFGNAIINEEEYNKFLLASAKERKKLLKEEQKEFNMAIRNFGKNAFEDSAIANSARRAGFRLVEDTIKGIEDADLQKQVSDSIKESLSRTDMSVFINARGQFDTSALKKFTEQQVDIFQNLFMDIETLSEVEGAALKRGGDAVEARVESINKGIEEYKNALKEIQESDLTDEQKAELEMALELTFSGEAALLELIEERNIDVEIVAELSIRGMNNNEIAAFITRQMAPIADRAQKEAIIASNNIMGRARIKGFDIDPDADLATEREKEQANIDELKAKPMAFQTDATKAAHAQAIKQAEQRLALIDGLIVDVEEKRVELENEGSDLLTNVFTGGDDALADNMMAYKKFLMESIGLTAEEADAQMNMLFNALGTKTSSAIASSIKDTKTDREKLFGLQEELAKGNFEGLVELAQTYGREAVEAFTSGDPTKMEAFFAQQKAKTLSDLESSIQALKGKRNLTDEEQANLLELESLDNLNKAQQVELERLQTKESLTEAEEAELLALETMVDFYDQMSAADQERTFHLGRAKKLISEMNDLLKIAGDLMTLGLSDQHPLIAMLNSLANTKYESSIASLQTELENEFEALSEFGTFDANGVFTFNQDADMAAGQAALDGYIDTLGEYTSTLVAEYNRQADAIKKRYQGEIDAIKDAFSERHKEIEHLDKIKELEEKIVDARRKLMAFSLDGSMAGQMTDNLESLQKLQQERQKMIEQKMIEEAQKELEAERDNALLVLGRQQISTMEGLIESLDILNETLVQRGQPEIVTPRGGGGEQSVGRAIMNLDSFGVFGQ